MPIFKSLSGPVAGEQLGKLREYRLLIHKGELQVAWCFEIVGGKSRGQTVIVYTSPSARECRAVLKCLAEKSEIRKGLYIDAHNLVGKYCTLDLGDGRALLERCKTAAKIPAS